MIHNSSTIVLWHANKMISHVLVVVQVSRVKDLHREFQAAKDVRRFATSDSSVFDMNVPNTKVVILTWPSFLL